jgi:hypothetical protein
LGRTSIGGKIENKYPPYNIRLCLSPERLSVTRFISIDIRPATRNLTREADRNMCKVPNDILFLSGFKIEFLLTKSSKILKQKKFTKMSSANLGMRHAHKLAAKQIQ